MAKQASMIRPPARSLRGAAARAALCLLLSLSGAPRAVAQSTEAPQSEIEARAAKDAADQARAQAAAAEKAAARAERLAADSRRIGAERAALGRSIVAREDALNRAARHLDALRQEIATTRARLGATRTELQALLGRMQRAAREPTPALVAHPDRPVSAARGALLMRAISERLRRTRETMAADLEQLDDSARRVEAIERAAAGELTALRQEEARAAMLLERKRAAEAAERAAAEKGRAEAAELGRKAQSLAALAAELQAQEEREARSAPRLAAAPRPKARPETRPETGPAATPRSDAEPEEELVASAAPSRQEPRVSTPRAPRVAALPGGGGGRFLKPASGEMSRAQDEARDGVFLFTRPFARVISPASGLVRYVGDITSEGKVVIIEPQSGVLVFLVGLGSVEATMGGRVAAGEPIGRMGGPPSQSEEFMFELTEETAGARERLYVEMYKKGRRIDPWPWFGADLKEVAAND